MAPYPSKFILKVKNIPRIHFMLGSTKDDTEVPLCEHHPVQIDTKEK